MLESKLREGTCDTENAVVFNSALKSEAMASKEVQ
jgi:hypothetical protein